MYTLSHTYTDYFCSQTTLTWLLVCTYTHIVTHSRTYTFIHTYIHMRICDIYTCLHNPQKQTERTCMCAAHTHTHTHTHMQTNMYTYTQAYISHIEYGHKIIVTANVTCYMSKTQRPSGLDLVGVRTYVCVCVCVCV